MRTGESAGCDAVADRTPRELIARLWWCQVLCAVKTGAAVRRLADTTFVTLLSRQQPENPHSVGRAYVDFSVGNHRRDELVSVAKVIAPICRLVRVVELYQRLRV